MQSISCFEEVVRVCRSQIYTGTYIQCKAYLTQNTQLSRLSARVNCTYSPTYRGVILVTLGQFECFRESRVWFLKLFKNLVRLWCPCIWLYRQSYKTVRKRVRSYETVYTTVNDVHSMSMHIRFQTIAVRPIRFKYGSFMVRNGYTLSRTGIHGLNVH